MPSEKKTSFFWRKRESTQNSHPALVCCTIKARTNGPFCAKPLVGPWALSTGVFFPSCMNACCHPLPLSCSQGTCPMDRRYKEPWPQVPRCCFFVLWRIRHTSSNHHPPQKDTLPPSAPLMLPRHMSKGQPLRSPVTSGPALLFLRPVKNSTHFVELSSSLERHPAAIIHIGYANGKRYPVPSEMPSEKKKRPFFCAKGNQLETVIRHLYVAQSKLAPTALFAQSHSLGLERFPLAFFSSCMNACCHPLPLSCSQGTCPRDSRQGALTQVPHCHPICTPAMLTLSHRCLLELQKGTWKLRPAPTSAYFEFPTSLNCSIFELVLAQGHRRPWNKRDFDVCSRRGLVCCLRASTCGSQSSTPWSVAKFNPGNSSWGVGVGVWKWPMPRNLVPKNIVLVECQEQMCEFENSKFYQLVCRWGCGWGLHLLRITLNTKYCSSSATGWCLSAACPSCGWPGSAGILLQESSLVERVKSSKQIKDQR